MLNLDPRTQIIEEMLGLYAQKVPEQRVKGYLRHLKDIGTDALRAACAGCIEHGSQRGAPTVAEIRRRAAEIGTRRRDSEPEEELQAAYRECKRVVSKTRYGKLLCCREEGHWGDCEAWFDRDGPQPEDAETIAGLAAAEGKTGSLQEPEGLLEDIPF